MTSLAPPVNIVMGCHWTKKNLKSEYVATALDEARQREVQRHNQNVSRYSNILKHRINVAIFLCAQGLAFLGRDESYESSDRGNVLELMDTLGDYSHELRVFLDNERITYTSHEP